ncbi:high mobility group nucleosome-binding domain-containing protein 5-like [Anolis sagrei]|uniref:high mobility group nucleosome-binding domain-containing protein 5-like n=1 Tax=Anolis sagrei TaxID=38937 RepID=UPI0035210743
MLEGENEFILSILEELEEEKMKKFLFLLNKKETDGNTIPQGKLEGADAVKVAKLLAEHHHPWHLEVLEKTLRRVPHHALADRVSTVIKAEKEKRENPIEEMDGIPAKKAKYSQGTQYEGKYRLPDMEVYATENQGLLIEKLIEDIGSSAFKTLEEELAMRKLKNVFSFNAAQFYKVVTNQELKVFLSKDRKKTSHGIPSKILDLMLHPSQKNKKTKQMSQPRQKKPIPSPNSTSEQKLSNERQELPTDKVKGNAQISKEDIKNDNVYAVEQEPEVKKKVSLLKNEKNNQFSMEDFTRDFDGDYNEKWEGEETKELPENKQKGDLQISKENTFTEELDIDCDEEGEGDERKELPENRQKGNAQISQQDTFTEELDIDCDEKEGDQRKKIPENRQKGNAQISKQDTFTEELDIDCDEEGEGDERKEIPDNNQKGNAQISKQDTFTRELDIDCDEEGEVDEKKELLENKQKRNVQISKEDTFTEELDIDCDEKEGDERKRFPENRQKGNAQISKEDTFTEELDIDCDDRRIGYYFPPVPQQDTFTEELGIDCDDEGEEDERKEFPENKQKGDPQISKENTFIEEPDDDYDGEGDEKKEEQRNFIMEMEPVHESKKDTIRDDKKTKKGVSENELYKNLARAIRKHYEGKKHCIKIWCNYEHEKYKCFKAQDVIVFKLEEEEETEYRILHYLQDDKDLNKNDWLKKNVEFELQFNMAVLGVQCSECISINSLKSVKANSFRQHEEILESIVSDIVLPVLALYKRVERNTFFEESLE